MNKPLLPFLHCYLVVLVVTMPTPTQARGRNFGTTPLDNAELYQAVQYWTGTDHNKAEIQALLGPIDSWDTSQVTSFNSLFKGMMTFDEDLSQWNTSSVTDMADAFSGCSSMRGKPSLENWDTSKVTSFARMFKSATSWEGDLSYFDTSSVTDMSYMFQGATFFKGDGLEVWDVSKVVTFNFMFNRATNFNRNISSWNMESAEFLEGMFEYAVSFDQNISAWNMTTVKSVDSIFEGAAQFDRSVCWPELQEDTMVNSMFCDSHPGAHLDPCCVTSGDLITNGCCGGSCDTFCPPVSESGTRPPVSNDTPEPVADDDSLLEEDADGDDDSVQVVVDTSTTVPVATMAPTQVVIEVNVTDSNGTAAEDNNEDGAVADTDTTIVSIEGEQSENTANEEDEGNLWQREVWLRIAVYMLILIIVGGIFLYILHVKTKGRRRGKPAVANTDEEEGEAAATKDDEKDEEVGMVETKPTEDTDPAGEVVKPMEGSESKADEEAENKPAEEEDVAPPESPKK